MTVINERPDIALFVVNRIIENITGLNQAMLHRARIFTSNDYCRVAIVTTRFEPDYYRYLRSSLLNRGYINDQIEVYNLFEYFKDEPEEIFGGKSPDDSLRKNGNHDGLGNRVVLRHRNDQGAITGIDYFRSDGSRFMSREYNDENISKIHIHARDGNIKKSFDNENKLKHYFFDQIIKENDALVVAEARSVDHVVANYKNDRVLKAVTIHNKHNVDPYNEDSELNSHRYIIENSNKFDFFVTTTEQQLCEIKKITTDKIPIYAIPHACRSQSRRNRSIPRPEIKAVIASRLDSGKNVDHAIMAVSAALKSGQSIKLDIYGHADKLKDETYLRELIERLGCANNIALKGFAYNLQDIFNQSDLMICPSEFEAFGLSMLEALSQGCPVLAYDAKYGPSIMINDGVNGIIAERKNVASLSAGIKRFATLDVDSMKEQAYQSSLDFSEDRVLDGWNRAFDNLRGTNMPKIEHKGNSMPAELENDSYILATLRNGETVEDYADHFYWSESAEGRQVDTYSVISE